MIDRHIDSLRGKYSEYSCKRSGFVLRAFFRDLNIAPVAVTPALIESYFRPEGNPRWEVSRTERLMFSIISRFFRWAVGVGAIPSDPTTHYTPPPCLARRARAEPYTESEFARLLTAANHTDSRFLSTRLAAWLWVMRDTGKKPGALRRLARDAFKGDTLNVQGKTAPLGSEASEGIVAMCAAAPPSEWLFCDQSGQQLSENVATWRIPRAVYRATGVRLHSARMAGLCSADGLDSFGANPSLTLGDGPLVTVGEDYLANCQSRGLKNGTITALRAALTQFLTSPDLPDDPRDLTRQHFERFLAREHNRGLSPFTVHRHFRGLKSWCSFMEDHGYVETSPMHRLKAPRLPKQVIRPYSPADVVRLLAVAREPRDEALLLVLHRTGLRASEASHLRLSDVGAGRLLVRQGKGDKDRYVPLSDDTERRLRAFFNSDGVFPRTGSGIQSGHPEAHQRSRTATLSSCSPLAGHIFRPVFRAGGGGLSMTYRSYSAMRTSPPRCGTCAIAERCARSIKAESTCPAQPQSGATS